jgi:hypothetical protein
MDRIRLLHNMSVPSRTVISHDAPRSCCRWIAFSLPEGENTPSEVLSRLDGTAWVGTPDDADRELRVRINQHAAKFSYPRAILVAGRMEDAAGSPSDLLTICTVLSKSSTRVYLCDKEPNLANLRGGRTVVLQFPASEAAHD